MKIERIKLTTGLKTDVSPKAIDTQGNRLVVNPVIDALNARIVSSENGTDYIFQSVKGNLKVTNPDLPAGTNVQIGAFEDVERNVLIFFLYNSNNNHGIYKYSPDTSTITTIMQDSLLNFQNNPLYLITGIGIQGDMLYWSDGYNPQRAINMTRSYAGITSDKAITLIKEHPTTRPDVLGSSTVPQGHPAFRDNDITIPVNKISDKNLQFSYQYVFIDNEKSVLAPFSKMAYAALDPSDDIDSSNKNTIPFRHTIPSDIYSFVKYINLLVREGNEGLWSTWKKVHPTSADIEETYSGYESLTGIADAEAAKIQEAIPTASKALAVHRNRVMVSADREGFDVALASGEFPIAMAITEVLENYTSGPSNNTYFKKGGSKTFGIAVFDGRGRSMGVFGKVNIKFATANDANSGTDNFETSIMRPYVTINLTGDLSASPDAAYISLVESEDEYYEDYIQIPVIPFFYRYDKPTTHSFFAPSPEFIMNGRVFYKGIPDADTKFNKIHLLLPKEAAIIPTDEYLVRLMSKRSTAPFSTAKLERVVSVINSQFIVVDNFGITDWSGLSSHDSIADPLFVEIFKIRATPRNTFYEVTDRIPLTNGAPAQTSFTIYGDQYYGTSSGLKFNFNVFDIVTISGDGATDATDEKTANVETPTPTYGFKTPVGTDPVTKEVLHIDYSVPSASKRNLVLDYSKADWNAGKTFIEVDNPVELNRSNVVRFSNPFIPDSSINGLSSFDSGDVYQPTDRTRIKKLVPVGNNVLAVHERSMTTLYIEQAMIKNTEGVEQLITTDKFIGYDRDLQTKVGSYHPESIQEYMGLVFGFDVFNGVAWQYSNEGISIISRFGRATFFTEIADAIRPYKDTCKIVGGIDPSHNEYLISFVFPDAQSAQNVTVGYNWDENIWTVRYSAVAEGYAKINKTLISFKDGELWEHHTNSLYNNFYGVQYQRSIKVSVNPFPTRSKNWMGIQIATNLLSSGVDAEMLVVRCYTESGQETYMKVDDFDFLEGVYYGPILKDINTLAALIPAGKLALRDGDDMLGNYIDVELINDHTTDACPVQFLNVSYADSEYTK